MAKILKRWMTKNNIKSKHVKIQIQPRGYGYQKYLEMMEAKRNEQNQKSRDSWHWKD